VVALKPNAYDARKREAFLAKAAADDADAHYVKIIAIGCAVALLLVGLYSVASMYLARGA
jgi:hypothetical protein